MAKQSSQLEAMSVMFANALTFTLLLQQFLSSNSLLALAVSANSCTWPNGAEATTFVACNPTASQSSCCLEGEACLQNGLCYGAIGFMYRGACAGFAFLQFDYSQPCPQERSAANTFTTAVGVILPPVQSTAALSQVSTDPGLISGPATTMPASPRTIQIGGVAWTMSAIAL
jgi:hypothetical protein